ncbi:hypothetical protein Aperf_G00000121797 [Anoplocephala perfoliata]
MDLIRWAQSLAENSMSGSDESEELIVEKVCGVRKEKDEWQYLIKWEGLPESDNIWVREQHLDCLYEIERFQEQFPRVFELMEHPNFTSGSVAERALTLRGFDRKLRVKKIVSATRGGGELKFLIRWEGTDEVDLVSAKEANVKCPRAVIAFYEQRLKFCEL